MERSRQATLAQLEGAKALPAAYLRTVFNSLEAQKWERKVGLEHIQKFIESQLSAINKLPAVLLRHAFNEEL